MRPRGDACRHHRGSEAKLNKRGQVTHGPLVETGIKNLDLLLYGGLPGGSVTVIGGTPGAGKTTLTHQICFHNATPERPALIFQTLSEPTAKTLVYLKQF